MADVPSVDADSRRPADGQLCTVFVVDIAGFTRPDRDDDIRRYLHEKLYELLERAFDASGISWAGCFHEDRGDGALIVVPPDVASEGIIDPLPERLRSLIRRHNHISHPAAGMQLRAAVHIGPVEHDGHGFTGSDINLLFRMLEARPLKQALKGSGAELALMVSEGVYRSLVGRHPSLVSPYALQAVRFQVKQTRGRAWIYLPRLAGEASQGTECDIDQVMAAFKTALAHMDHSTRETARIRNLANVTDAQEAAEEESRTPATPAGHTLSQVRETAAAPLAASVTRLAEPSAAAGGPGRASGAAILMKDTWVTGIDRSKLAAALGRRYDSGESIRSLAASTGRSYGFVHRILTETGVTLRGRGGATRSGKNNNRARPASTRSK